LEGEMSRRWRGEDAANESEGSTNMPSAYTGPSAWFNG